MEGFEKPTIGCRVNLTVAGDLGCQLCWMQRKGDFKANTREKCIMTNMVNLSATPVKKDDKKH